MANFHLLNWMGSQSSTPPGLVSSSLLYHCWHHPHTVTNTQFILTCPCWSQQACCLSLWIIFSHIDAAFACWEIAPICPSSQSRMNKANNSHKAFGLMEMSAAAPLGCTDIAIILLIQHVLLGAGADVHRFETNTLVRMYVLCSSFVTEMVCSQ